MLLLVIGGGYVQYTYTENVKMMDKLKAEQLKHVKEVNEEFRSDLKTLNLQFIGRGKHVKRNQLDIAANHKFTEEVRDSLAAMIDDVVYEMGEMNRKLSKEISNLQIDLESLSDDFSSENRRNKRNFKDLRDKTADLTARLEEIEQLQIIQKEKAKAQENK